MTQSVRSELSQYGLIIVDIQAGSKFLVEHLFRNSASLGLETVLKNDQKLVRLFTELNLPIYIVTGELPLMPKSVNDRFSRPLIEPKNKSNVYFLKKRQPNPFDQADFRQLLQNNGTTSLIISGISTDNAVKKTATSANNSGVTPIVLSDATIARSTKVQQKTLTTLAKVATTADIIRQFKNI